MSCIVGTVEGLCLYCSDFLVHEGVCTEELCPVLVYSCLAVLLCLYSTWRSYYRTISCIGGTVEGLVVLHCTTSTVEGKAVLCCLYSTWRSMFCIVGTVEGKAVLLCLYITWRSVYRRTMSCIVGTVEGLVVLLCPNITWRSMYRRTISCIVGTVEGLVVLHCLYMKEYVQKKSARRMLN